MKLRGIGGLARRFVRSATGRRGRWVTTPALALALVVLLQILHNPLSSPEFVIGAVVGALASIFFVLPNVLVRPEADLTREQLLKARNDVRIAGIQIVGGAA